MDRHSYPLVTVALLARGLLRELQFGQKEVPADPFLSPTSSAKAFSLFLGRTGRVPSLGSTRTQESIRTQSVALIRVPRCEEYIRVFVVGGESASPSQIRC